MIFIYIFLAVAGWYLIGLFFIGVCHKIEGKELESDDVTASLKIAALGPILAIFILIEFYGQSTPNIATFLNKKLGLKNEKKTKKKT